MRLMYYSDQYTRVKDTLRSVFKGFKEMTRHSRCISHIPTCPRTWHSCVHVRELPGDEVPEDVPRVSAVSWR